MHVITAMQRGGEKTLPPEIIGWDRLSWAGAQMQTDGGVEGLSGIGQDAALPSSDFGYYDPTSAAQIANDWAPASTQSGSGVNWNQLANLVNVASIDTAKLLAASNPGTLYRAPDGTTIYSQPTGNMQNLLVGSVPSGVNVNTPLLQSSGVSTTVLLIGAAFVAAMVFGKR